MSLAKRRRRDFWVNNLISRSVLTDWRLVSFKFSLKPLQLLSWDCVKSVIFLFEHFKNLINVSCLMSDLILSLREYLWFMMVIGFMMLCISGDIWLGRLICWRRLRFKELFQFVWHYVNLPWELLILLGISQTSLNLQNLSDVQFFALLHLLDQLLPLTFKLVDHFIWIVEQLLGSNLFLKVSEVFGKLVLVVLLQLLVVLSGVYLRGQPAI